MVSTAELRKALGKKADGLSDAEIERISALLKRLSKSLFDQWHRNLVTNSEHSHFEDVTVR